MGRLIAFEILDTGASVAINPNRVQAVVAGKTSTKIQPNAEIVLADRLTYTVRGSYADVVGRLNSTSLVNY